MSRNSKKEGRSSRGVTDGEGARGVRIVGITVLSHWCGHPVNTVEARYRYRLRRLPRRNAPASNGPAVIRGSRHTVHPTVHRFDCNSLPLFLFLSSSSALGRLLAGVCLTDPVGIIRPTSKPVAGISVS